MQGFLEVKSISPEGEVKDRAFVKNVITFGATNILARCLGGDLTFKPTHFIIGGSVPASVPGTFPTVSRSDTDLDINIADPNNSKAEIPISSVAYSASPTTGAPTGQQTTNVVTFTAILPAVPSDATLNGRSFYEAGIITKIGSTNTLFSHQFHSAIQKLEGFQLVYTWSVRLT